MCIRDSRNTERGKNEKNSKGIYYTNGNYEAFARPKKPQGVEDVYKRQVYQCEDCSGCPYAEQCKKTDKNRTVRINRELTAMQDVYKRQYISHQYSEYTEIKVSL